MKGNFLGECECHAVFDTECAIMKTLLFFFRMRFSRGFTLVEVMLVMAFIGIMTGVVFVSLSTRRSMESAKSAAREVAAAVRETQGSALSGLRRGKNSSVPDGRSICRYEITQTSATEYQSSVFHANDCSIGSPTSLLLRTYTLPNGVRFSSPLSSPWRVVFAVPRGEVTPGNVSISLAKGGSSFSVCVSSAGSVKESASCP